MNWKRVAGMIATMIGFAALVWFASVAPSQVSLWILCSIAAAGALACIYLLWRPLKKVKLIITAAMITSLVGATVNTPAQPAPPPDEEQFLGPCIIAAAVLGIGIYIVFKLKRLCDRCVPPKDQPPQPPPANTNRVSRLIGDNPITLSIDADNLTIYDVSTNTFTNKDPDGGNYIRWIAGTLHSSTNMLSWKREASFNLWVSSRWQTIVWYDGNGSAICTNTVRSGEQSECAVPVLADSDNKFFKVIQ